MYTVLSSGSKQVFFVTHAFLAQMVERGKGVIVNVSSVEGVRAYPSDPVYRAGRGGRRSAASARPRTTPT